MARDWRVPCVASDGQKITDTYKILRESIMNHFIRYGVEEIQCDDTLLMFHEMGISSIERFPRDLQ